MAEVLEIQIQDKGSGGSSGPPRPPSVAASPGPAWPRSATGGSSASGSMVPASTAPKTQASVVDTIVDTLGFGKELRAFRQLYDYFTGKPVSSAPATKVQGTTAIGPSQSVRPAAIEPAALSSIGMAIEQGFDRVARILQPVAQYFTDLPEPGPAVKPSETPAAAPAASHTATAAHAPASAGLSHTAMSPHPAGREAPHAPTPPTLTTPPSAAPAHQPPHSSAITVARGAASAGEGAAAGAEAAEGLEVTAAGAEAAGGALATIGSAVLPAAAAFVAVGAAIKLTEAAFNEAREVIGFMGQQAADIAGNDYLGMFQHRLDIRADAAEPERPPATIPYRRNGTLGKPDNGDAVMVLPNSGNCTCNGVSFTSMYRSKVEVKPVRDSASRALVAREYTIDVEGHVVAGLSPTTDVTLAAMRIALEKPAGALVFTNKGFGPLSVNVAGGSFWDASYGPWPEVLAWDPVGNDQGCLVRWKCSTLVPCEESPSNKGVIEYCWSESWDIDQDGYTTRTIEGQITVQATRPSVNSRGIPDNADNYRADVTPDLPVGFKREQHFHLSEDKRTLDFSFKDEELPQPLPYGTTGCQVAHRAKWTLPKAGNAPWQFSTLSGTITLPARMPHEYAWNKIVMIMRSRWPVGGSGGMAGALAGAASAALAAIAAGTAGNAGGAAPSAGTGATYLLQDVEIDDEVFGRSVRFSATCAVIPKKIVNGVAGPSLLLTTTGLWAPIPNTTFVRWKQSVFGAANKPYSPRGMAGMGFENEDDAIVDLCSNENALTANATVPGKASISSTQPPRQSSGGILSPGNTWLKYRLRIRLLENDRIARHEPIGTPTLPKAVPPLVNVITQDVADAAGLQIMQTQDPNPMDNVIGLQGAGYIGGVPDLMQQVSTPTQTIRLEGFAVRIGYPIPTPRLDVVNGQKVKQLR